MSLPTTDQPRLAAVCGARAAWVCILMLAMHSPRAETLPVNFEVVVYGGTSAGVIAAVQAARMGSSVVLLEPGSHLGGMTSGGLGATDVGKAEAVGGLSREFYRLVKQYYSKPSAWKYGTLENYSTHGFDRNSDVMWNFEPHVAENIFNELIRESGVKLLFEERLDLSRGVTKKGGRILSIRMESGLKVSGGMFIDASYEGDLMAKAGVSYTVGREANDQYGETHNGNQWQHMRRRPKATGHDFSRAVDPYLKPGDPSSGTIIGVPTNRAGVVGTTDRCVQAYCFRLCLTDIPENRVPFTKPADYDPARYELLLRDLTSSKPLPEWPIESDPEHPVLGNTLMNEPPKRIMPNRKSDSNSKGAVSFNFVGGNYDYPDGDHATRQKIIEAHKSWQQGLIWFVANDPRVPRQYREPMRKWGLAKDEFRDGGNWPHQLYIREGRRMVGAFVMTQHVCEGRVSVPDPVGLGSYTMDSHNVRRYIDENGFVRNEGTLGLSVKKPYGISMRSLIPRKSECENLVVPVCISATHVVYGSMRMEPVFMVLGQSAATAAVQALRAGLAVQDINYAALRRQLEGDGQVLEAGSTGSEKKNPQTTKLK